MHSRRPSSRSPVARATSAETNRQSKGALWATKTRSRSSAVTSPQTSLKRGASLTMSHVMFVRAVIQRGMGRIGFTSVS